MNTCAACGASVPVNQRWCDACHHDRFRPGPADLASPARRLAAFLVDESIPLIALFGMATGALLAHSFGLLILLFLGYVVWALSLFARGLTPGKLIMGIQVVKQDGRPADFLTMLVRETFGKFISGLVFMMGWIWILIDKEHQGWHDKLVGTYVVYRASDAHATNAASDAPLARPAPRPAPAATVPSPALTVSRPPPPSPPEASIVTADSFAPSRPANFGVDAPAAPAIEMAYCVSCGTRGVVGRSCTSCAAVVE